MWRRGQLCYPRRRGCRMWILVELFSTQCVSCREGHSLGDLRCFLVCSSFRGSLSLLKRLLDFVCRLVGLSVVVHGDLSPAFVGWCYSLVKVGIFQMTKGTLELWIKLYIESARLPLFIYRVFENHGLPFDIILFCCSVNGTPFHLLIGRILPSASVQLLRCDCSVFCVCSLP